MTVRDSSKPLYIQVQESLKNAIKTKKYPVGSKLPSEKALCEEFKVSRITIRQALELLENQGLTNSVHGKGTFVKSKAIDSDLQKVSSFGETLKHMGYEGHTKITHYEERKTDDFERMIRGELWESVSCFSLTGYAGDEPIVLYNSVIRNPYGTLMHKIALEYEKNKIPFSTFDLYEEIGLEIGKIEQKVAAVNADEETAKILNINKGDAILVLDSVIMDKNLQPVEYKKGYYRTEKYAFKLHREL